MSAEARGVAVGLLLFLAVASCERSGPRAAPSPTPDLVGAALSDDDALRSRALTRVAEGLDEAQVTRLLGHLEDTDEAVVARAVEALATAQARAAVPGLIRLSRDVAEEEAPTVIAAIGRIGGPQAEAYLFTVSTGSPEPAIRAAARAARAELEGTPEAAAVAATADREEAAE